MRFIASKYMKSSKSKLLLLILFVIIIVLALHHKLLLTPTNEEINSLHSQQLSRLYISNIHSESSSSSSSASKFMYATFMGSVYYKPALEVFISTFAKTKPRYSLAICIPEKNEDELNAIIATTISVLSKYNDTLPYHIMIWPIITPPKNSKERERWSINWTKLQLWSMIQYEKIFYVDLDVIFFKNVDNIFTDFMNDTSSSFLGTYDWGKYSKIGTEKMNGGVFLLQPSMSTFSKLLHAKEMIKTYRSIEAEQGLLNKYFIQTGCCLSYYYNVQKTAILHLPSLWNASSIMILHYTGEKPWTSWSTTNFRSNYINNKQKTALKKMDNWDADEYTNLHDLWKHEYFVAREQDFNKLTLFQGFHSKNCWKYLNTASSYYKHVRLDGPLRPPNHSSTLSAAPSSPSSLLSNDVDNIRKGKLSFSAVGANDVDIDSDLLLRSEYTSIEIDSMNKNILNDNIRVVLAMRNKKNQTKLTEFVGFSSWNEQFYANSSHGASIDWTKIDFQQNTVYYWYGIYSENNYYATMASSFPGIINVLKSCISFQLPKMTSRFYSYNYNIILSKELYLIYSKSLYHFALTFWKKYNQDSSNDTLTCPFDFTKYSNNNPDDNKSSCFDIIAEFYLNVWVCAQGYKQIYAVDNPAWRIKKNQNYDKF